MKYINNIILNSQLQMMKWIGKAMIVMIGLVFFMPNAHSTHVIGGNMYYKCLGNGQYEITLDFRRDCFNGADNAQFDNPINIGIYDDLGNLQTGLGVAGIMRINLIEDDTVGNTLTSICKIEGEDVCVQLTTYKDTLFLPNNGIGYTLAYQRCCRNFTVNNIVNPLETGSTYSVDITEEALNNCNSSPVFKKWPDVYICNNMELSFDHSASDADGDSLVYEICHPRIGGSQADPHPATPSAPPYDLVEFQEPYSLGNLLGGEPLRIDPQTGLVTAVPDLVGQYLVAICVKEYRNGELLSLTYRDFQYNVRVCKAPVIADFNIPNNPNCTGLEISFENNSSMAEYNWFFNWPDTTAVSSDRNPMFTYPEAGLYEVVLIVKDDICVDTARVTLGVSTPDDLNIDFDINFDACSDDLDFSLTDNTTTVQGISAWEWTINYQEETLMSKMQHPDFYIDSDLLDSIEVSLMITGVSGCTAILTKKYAVSYVKIDFVAEADRTICVGDSTSIVSMVSNPMADFAWNPTISLDLTDPANPIAFPLFTTTYHVTVTDGLCSLVDSVTVFVSSADDITVDFELTPLSCRDSLVFQLDDKTTATQNFSMWEWGILDMNRDVLQLSSVQNPRISLGQSDLDSIIVILVVTGESGCPAILEKSFEVGLIELQLAEDNQEICLGQSIDLVVSSDSSLNYKWTPTTDLDLTDPSHPIATPQLNTKYVVEVSNGLCTIIDSITVNVAIEKFLNISGETIVCDDDVTLQALGEFENQVEWFSDRTMTNSLGNENPITITGLMMGNNTFFVNLVGDVCNTTRMITVERADFTLDFVGPLNGVVCTGNSFEIKATPSISEFSYTYKWTPENMIISGSDTANPVFQINEAGTISISYEIINNKGCMVTGVFNVEALDNPEKLDDEHLIACPNEAIELNPNGRDSYDYNWSSSVEGVLAGMGNISNPKVIITEATTFIVTISVPGDTICQTIDTLTVDLSSPNAISFDSYPNVICYGSEINLNAETQQPSTITWSDLDGNNLGDNPVMITASNIDVFITMAEDMNGCIITDTLRLNITDEIEIEVSPEALICDDDEIQILVTNLNAMNDLTYVWQPSESIVGDNTTAGITVKPIESTTYTVVATDTDGCSTEGSVFVKVSVFDPSVEISADPDEIILGETSDLEVNQDPGFTYEWDNAESLSDATIYNPTATPTDLNTVYTVKVTNDDGCTAFAKIVLTVLQPQCDDTDVFVPNMFSPNGDGTNDVFRVESNYIDKFYMLIYDRWGEEVFVSNSQDQTWDGTCSNKMLTPDVYGYYIKATCINNIDYIKKGNITLIR